MRIGTMAFLLGVLYSLAWGQQLTRTIYLPDSLGVAARPEYLCLDSTARVLYVSGGGDWLLKVSSATSERLGRVFTGGRSAPVWVDPRTQQLYVGDTRDSTLVVLDRTGGIKTRLHLPGQPRSLYFEPTHNKLYVATFMEPCVVVIDLTVDTVLVALPYYPTPRGFCSSPDHSKVYCSNELARWVTVIDAVGDSLLRRVAIREPDALCAGPNGKIYCSSGRGHIYAIDATADTIAADIQVSQAAGALCYSTVQNKVYCSVAAHDVAVIDCTGDTLIGTLPLNAGAGQLLYNPLNDRVYCAGYGGGVTVIDASTDSVLRVVPTQPGTTTLLLDQRSNLVYATNVLCSQLSVIDARQDSIIATIETGCRPEAVGFASMNGHAYACFRRGTQGYVAVIDGESGAVLQLLAVPHTPFFECPVIRYNPDMGKVYIADVNRGYMSVIDCRNDSLVRDFIVPSDGGGDVCLNPANNRLYVTGLGSGDLSVVDCQLDSVVSYLPMASAMEGICLNPDLNRIYVHPEMLDTSWVLVLDCANDSIIARVEGLWFGGPMCYDPVNRLVYAADDLNPYVTLIDTRTNRSLTWIQTIANMSDACCSPASNKVYFSSWAYPMAVVDGVSDSMIAAVPVGWPEDIMYVSATDRVYCAGGDIYVVDCATDSVIAVVPAHTYAECALALDSIGGFVYVANEYGSSVLVIRDTLQVAVTESRARRLPSQRLRPTVIRGVLWLPRDMTELPGNSDRVPRLALLDISGRKVFDLLPGPNDVRHLSPGVYFVREHSALSGRHSVRGASGVTKVIVTR